jgi:hypothetical protein
MAGQLHRELLFGHVIIRMTGKAVAQFAVHKGFTAYGSIPSRTTQGGHHRAILKRDITRCRFRDSGCDTQNRHGGDCKNISHASSRNTFLFMCTVVDQQGINQPQIHFNEFIIPDAPRNGLENC